MKISIVTTAYNIEAYVEKCLESLLAQTHKDIEIIVVNDCSTDKTLDIVAKFTDERIKVVNHSQNMGAGWARRTGIAAATGDYVITVDGDDWLAPDFIEALAKNAEETDADIVQRLQRRLYTLGVMAGEPEQAEVNEVIRRVIAELNR